MDTERKTGIVWSYRLPEHKYYRESFRGDFATRHEAIGHATIMTNLLGLSEWEVRWHESIWREVDTPTVCGHCGHEEFYMPLVGWTLAEGGPFCSMECHARYLRKHDPEQLEWVREKDRERQMETDDPSSNQT